MAKRVLVVEDDPALAELFKQGVAIEGSHELVVTETGEEALERFQENTFDLVIADYRLPRMNGLELIAAIRELDKTTQCIVVTGYRDDEMEAEASRLNVCQIFGKPFYIPELREAVNEALARQRPAAGTTPPPPKATPAAAAAVAAAPRPTPAKPARAPADPGQLLEDLARELNAVCALLTDEQGGLALYRGTLDAANAEQLASLVWRSFGDAAEVGALLGEQGKPHHILQEGDAYHVYSFAIGDGRLLTVAYDVATPIGMVRYRTRQAVQAIQRT
ncbi:MAG: response regulator [Chloroflexi bacterium]|nr:response regulator [Chloroflexota bacterium]MBU1747188.1 response regulator [Chloroflexota bacterium]MBU1879745.1 response regulator [Chloroflexota bacterium]